MADLRILGPLELRADDGHPLRSLHAQPKRLGLLAYLAIARPGGSSRRDTVLALLWPQLDESHARAALRQAAYHLRQVLGDAAIVNGPHDELALDPDVVHCDACAFTAAVAEGRPEAAMAHYRGDLLEGFHLRGTPGFDEWRERERSRLREQAAAAAWSVAGLRATQGEVEEAAQWGRRALALAHDDEVVLQRYLRLLERLGDRVRAVLEYEAFERRIRRDYDIEPTVETRRIIAAIRLHVTVESPAVPVVDHVASRRAAPGRPRRVPARGDEAAPEGRLPRWPMTRWTTAAIVGSTLLTALAAWWAVR